MNFTLEEVEDGFKLHIKGDKEKLRPKLEAIQAFLAFRQKAKAAGWPIPGPMHGMHMMNNCQGMHGHGMHGHGQGQGNSKIMEFMKDMMGGSNDKNGKKEDI